VLCRCVFFDNGSIPVAVSQNSDCSNRVNPNDRYRHSLAGIGNCSISLQVAVSVSARKSMSVIAILQQWGRMLADSRERGPCLCDVCTVLHLLRRWAVVASCWHEAPNPQALGRTTHLPRHRLNRHLTHLLTCVERRLLRNARHLLSLSMHPLPRLRRGLRIKVVSAGSA
jgi:hypothetical protein